MYKQNVSPIFAIIIKTTCNMFTFEQYLGFLAFASILTMGFWLMIFLMTFVIPYWVLGSSIERFNEIKAERKAKKEALTLEK